MLLEQGDVIRLWMRVGEFIVDEVWSEKELLTVGGLVVQISDVVAIVKQA